MTSFKYRVWDCDQECYNYNIKLNAHGIGYYHISDGTTIVYIDENGEVCPIEEFINGEWVQI